MIPVVSDESIHRGGLDVSQGIALFFGRLPKDIAESGCHTAGE